MFELVSKAKQLNRPDTTAITKLKKDASQIVEPVYNLNENDVLYVNKMRTLTFLNFF